MVWWSGYWRYVRARPGVEPKLWIRRGRCTTCKSSHALLPSFLLEARVDPVEVVGTTLWRSVSGVGLRKLAAEVGRPHTTVREWRRRHRARARALWSELAALVVSMGGAVPKLSGDLEHSALALLGLAWERGWREHNGQVAGLWPFTSVVTGGRWLATTTHPP
jgi:hypothetical protein